MEVNTNIHHFLVGEIFTVIGNLFIGFSSAIIGYIMLTNIEYF